MSGPEDLRELETELATLRAQIERGPTGQLLWNADEGDVQRSVVQLVLTLVEFIRELLERQAVRRMTEGTLSDDEIERVGKALLEMRDTVLALCQQFGINDDDLSIDLGPLGRLR